MKTLDHVKNLLLPSRIRQDAIEREKMARLEAAEAEGKQWSERSERAIAALTARHDRNHWVESVTKMIQGVH